jgi:hypothetical protein
MALKFDELRPETQERYLGKAKLAWDLLVAYASKNKTDSYELFGSKIGVGKYQVGPWVLYHIREHCSKNNLPLLNCLILRADGKCGERWTTRQESDNFEQKSKEVFAFDWSKIKNPF